MMPDLETAAAQAMRHPMPGSDLADLEARLGRLEDRLEKVFSDTEPSRDPQEDEWEARSVRESALDRALQFVASVFSTGNHSDIGERAVVATARAFEAYLKGEQSNG